MPDVRTTFSSDNREVLAALKEMQRETVKLRDENRKLKEESKRGAQEAAAALKAQRDEAKRAANEAKAAEQSQNAGLRGTIGQLSQVTAGYLGVSRAIGLVSQAFSDMERRRDDAGKRLQDAKFGLAQLAQLAGGDPTKLQSLVADSKKLYAEGGAANLDQAAKTVFALNSASIGEHRNLFRDLYGVFSNPEETIRAAAAIETSMGRAKTGDVRSILSKGIVASEPSPASTEGVLIGSSRAAGIANLLGISPEELLGATGILSKATGSAEEGGTQIASLLTAVGKEKGYKGLSLLEMLDKIKGTTLKTSDLTLTKKQKREPDRPLVESELIEYLGRKEALLAYGTLDLPENRAMLTELVAKQKVAVQNDLIGQVVKSKWAVPEIAAPLVALGEKASLEVSETGMGSLNELADAAESAWVQDLERQGYGPMSVATHRMAQAMSRTFLGDTQPILDYGHLLQGERKEVFDRSLQQLDPALFERMNATLESIEQNQRSGRLSTSADSE